MTSQANSIKNLEKSEHLPILKLFPKNYSKEYSHTYSMRTPSPW